MRVLLLFAALPLCAQVLIDNSWKVLDRGLHDSNPIKRVQAVTAMAIMRPLPKSRALVESAFDDKDYSIRQAACTALDEMKSRASIPKLKDALNDKAPEVVFAAAKALYDMGDPIGREVLIGILLGEQADSSSFFQSSMHDMKAKIHEPHELVMIGIKSGAGVLLGPGALGVPVAEGLMRDAQASGKTVAAALLAKDRSSDAMNAIREALSDKNWTVRAAACRALALANSTSDFETIAGLLDDKKEEVQYSAAAALIRLKQPATGGGAARTTSAPKSKK